MFLALPWHASETVNIHPKEIKNDAIRLDGAGREIVRLRRKNASDDSISDVIALLERFSIRHKDYIII